MLLPLSRDVVAWKEKVLVTRSVRVVIACAVGRFCVEGCFWGKMPFTRYYLLSSFFDCGFLPRGTTKQGCCICELPSFNVGTDVAQVASVRSIGPLMLPCRQQYDDTVALLWLLCDVHFTVHVMHARGCIC